MIDWMESSTFRGVHEAGECAGLCKVVVRLGTKRFGPPTSTLVALLEATEEPEQLHRIVDRLFDAKKWDDVVQVEWSPTEVEGTVHGSMVELDDEPAIPKGSRVRMSVARLAEPGSVGEPNGELPDDVERRGRNGRGQKKR